MEVDARTNHDRSELDTDGHGRTGTVTDGQVWPDWLTAKEAEVYSLQVHGFRIREKSWRRLTSKDPAPVQWREESLPGSTRYIFERSGVDTFTLQRKAENEALEMQRSKTDTADHDRPQMDAPMPDRAEAGMTGHDHAKAADTHKNEEIKFLRGQILEKDKQINALLERDRETNILIQNMQKQFALNAPPKNNTGDDGQRRTGMDATARDCRKELSDSDPAVHDVESQTLSERPDSLGE